MEEKNIIMAFNRFQNMPQHCAYFRATIDELKKHFEPMGVKFTTEKHCEYHDLWADFDTILCTEMSCLGRDIDFKDKVEEVLFEALDGWCNNLFNEITRDIEWASKVERNNYGFPITYEGLYFIVGNMKTWARTPAPFCNENQFNIFLERELGLKIKK